MISCFYKAAKCILKSFHVGYWDERLKIASNKTPADVRYGDLATFIRGLKRPKPRTYVANAGKIFCLSLKSEINILQLSILHSVWLNLGIVATTEWWRYLSSCCHHPVTILEFPVGSFSAYQPALAWHFLGTIFIYNRRLSGSRITFTRGNVSISFTRFCSQSLAGRLQSSKAA